MIKVNAYIASVGFLVLGVSGGCSSATTPDDGDGGSSSKAGSTSMTTSGTGTTLPTGGSTSQGGTTSQPTAGTTSMPTAGTSSGGSGGGAVGGVACKGIKSDMACMPEGQECPDLKCGLADSGVRSCLCQTTWQCMACDFSLSPFKDKPDPLEECTNQVDKLACPGMEGSVCQYPGGEACACAADDEGAVIWDCDKAPTTWAAAPAQ